MCMEDIRLGRATIHSSRVVTIPNSTLLIADYDSMRTQLLIYPPTAGVITVNLGSNTVANSGINLTSGDHPLVMTVETHGDLVKKAWSAIHTTASSPVFVSEGRLDAT